MTMTSNSSSVGDHRFYNQRGSFTLRQVVAAVGGRTTSADHPLAGLAPLNVARDGDVSFLNSRRYLPALAATTAGAVIVSPEFEGSVPASAAAILCPNPDEAWANVSGLFHPTGNGTPGIHFTASVASDATVHATAEIGAFACIEGGADIGASCLVEAHAVIGRGVRLGAGCRVGPLASISHAVLGQRVRVFPGARIGQEGFGFSAAASGFVSAPQLGRVVIGDDVSVGANTTIDRGSVKDTVIGAGTRIDSLVQIGHNVRIGRCCVIVAQMGIAGSTVLEDFVRVGGQAALAGHIHVGTGVQISAQAGLISDVPPHAVLLGSPAQPRHDFFRQVATLKRLARGARHPGACRESRRIGARQPPATPRYGRSLMCYPFKPASPTRVNGTGDPWLARASLPLYVGEVEALTLDAKGYPWSLVLDDGIAFAIPADMAGAGWSRLCPGDLVCIRHDACWIGDMLAVASVDTMDGQTSIAGNGVYQRQGSLSCDTWSRDTTGWSLGH